MATQDNKVSPLITEQSILGFFKEYRFLSNFHCAPLTVEGITYQNAEAAYMAQKSEDPAVKALFTSLQGKDAKQLGRRIALRPDWDTYRHVAMYNVLCAKFTQNVDLAQKLLSTGQKYLEETNSWGDTYWGVCNGKGQNWLGRTLMRIRSELQDGTLQVAGAPATGSKTGSK